MAGADHQHALAGVAVLLHADDVGNAVGDAGRLLRLARDGEPVDADRVRLRPGAGSVDHRAGKQSMLGAIVIDIPDHEGRTVAADGRNLVAALPRDRRDGRAQDQAGRDLRQRGKRSKILADDLAAGGQSA
jgi:hypothetical protein